MAIMSPGQMRRNDLIFHSGGIMAYLLDVWHAIHSIVTTSDIITLALMALIAAGAGFMIESFSSIVSATVVALIAFALASYLRAVIVGGQSAEQFASKDWQAFQSLHMLTLLAYALSFAAIIAVTHLARTLILRE
jgi:hypothetical protein